MQDAYKQKTFWEGMSHEDHFRVAIFGSAQIKKDDEIYKQVRDLAHAIGKRDIDLVTGGGPGLMGAASFGHSMAQNEDAQSIGLTIDLPHEAHANKHLDLKRHFHKFSSRLDTFMELSDVAVVVPGGIGTCLELFYTWQLAQVKHTANTPIILLGEMWHELIKWVRKYPLKEGLISAGDLDNIFCVETKEQALEIIFKLQEKHEEGIEEYSLTNLIPQYS
jgi:uncharacterized protein (TIGR00730 family)